MRNSYPSMAESQSNASPPEVVSTKTAEHYLWGDGCDGWFLLKGERFHVIQEKMPPRTAEVMHYHRRARQLFYVLRGELTMRTEGEPVVIAAGQAVVMEPAMAHQAKNDSDKPVEFLTISCPPSHGDRFNCQ